MGFYLNFVRRRGRRRCLCFNHCKNKLTSFALAMLRESYLKSTIAGGSRSSQFGPMASCKSDERPALVVFVRVCIVSGVSQSSSSFAGCERLKANDK